MFPRPVSLWWESLGRSWGLFPPRTLPQRRPEVTAHLSPSPIQQVHCTAGFSGAPLGWRRRGWATAGWQPQCREGHVPQDRVQTSGLSPNLHPASTRAMHVRAQPPSSHAHTRTPDPTPREGLGPHRSWPTGHSLWRCQGVILGMTSSGEHSAHALRWGWVPSWGPAQASPAGSTPSVGPEWGTPADGKGPPRPGPAQGSSPAERTSLL